MGTYRYDPESQRILTLVGRDGLGPTIVWCLQARRIYRRAVLDKNHFASRRPYRRRFIESYLALTRFLEDQHAL